MEVWIVEQSRGSRNNDDFEKWVAKAFGSKASAKAWIAKHQPPFIKKAKRRLAEGKAWEKKLTELAKKVTKYTKHFEHTPEWEVALAEMSLAWGSKSQDWYTHEHGYALLKTPVDFLA
jgi:hypothetical protein